jgi:hypothetical protein
VLPDAATGKLMFLVAKRSADEGTSSPGFTIAVVNAESFNFRQSGLERQP